MNLFSRKPSFIKMIFVSLGFCLTLALGACSNPFGGDKSKVDTNYGAQSPAEPAATGYEVVSGSKLSESTVSAQHKVDVTVGASTSQVRLVTNKNKIVYLNVQGQIISNE
ncbi:MAG: hypothetical protein B7Y39_01980 [Bdellovibrio sp. 28-41-41]|nr:MAG: hypothetical protein B7Y39_01980 [Bdellovibrio sp. 28-41-41]